jgi:hypothetical protein
VSGWALARLAVVGLLMWTAFALWCEWLISVLW